MPCPRRQTRDRRRSGEAGYYVAAITGITSERYVQIFPGMRHVHTATISLGVNDGEGTATAENLVRLRARVRQTSSIGC